MRRETAEHLSRVLPGIPRGLGLRAGWPRSAGVTPQAVWLKRGPAAAETVLCSCPGPGPRGVQGRRRSRPCLSASRLQYVPAFLLSLVAVWVCLECQEGSPSALGYRCLPSRCWSSVVLPRGRPPAPHPRRSASLSVWGGSPTALGINMPLACRRR